MAFILNFILLAPFMYTIYIKYIMKALQFTVGFSDVLTFFLLVERLAHTWWSIHLWLRTFHKQNNQIPFIFSEIFCFFNSNYHLSQKVISSF